MRMKGSVRAYEGGRPGNEARVFLPHHYLVTYIYIHVEYAYM